MTFTSNNLQNKIILSVVKYFSPNSLTKLRNLTLSEHITLGVLKVETLLSTQYKASFTNSGFVRTASAVYKFYYLLLYTAEADRTIITRAQIFSTTSQNMDNELRLTERGREKKSNIFFLLHVQCFWLLEVAYAVPVNTLSPHCFLCNIFLLKTVISDLYCF